MMDCKKALSETNGEMEAAVDWLRAKGLAAAAKKAGRTAAEGLVGVAVEGSRGAAVEVNSETDFVAKNELFQDFVRNVARLALQHGTDVEALGAAEYPGGGTVQEKLTDNIAKIGENQSLRRAAVLEVNQGVVVPYVHNQVAPGLGKIGVLVALESAASTDTLTTLGKQIAMHVAAANPQALDAESLDPALVERERAIAMEKAKESGKPQNIIEKMVEGGLAKFRKDSALLSQLFVMDNKTPVAEVVASAAKDAGASIQLIGFVRFQLGEGIEKKESDFAAEVAAAAGTSKPEPVA
jgi:elongation factor Ts